MEDYKIFDEINKTKGYEIALLTTFNLDVGFFERSVLYPLMENGIRDVSLFVDSKELNKAINGVSSCNIGQKYMMHPIEMNGAFHPKVFLLLGQNSAKLIVSSANITQTGYSYNNEIFNTFTFNDEHPQNLKIVNEAIHFFFRLLKLSPIKDDSLIERIKQLIYFDKSSKNDELFLVNNLDKSILEQITEIAKDVEEILVAVPYYDNELSALNEIKKFYPNAVIYLYIQNEKSKFPVKKHKSNDADINIFGNVGDSSNFYHGKVFLFRNKEESYIVYGSANCTWNAMVKTYKSDGNIECDVIEKGKPYEFYPFFDSFILCNHQELHCDIINYDVIDKYNYFFRYGILDGKNDTKLDLYIGFIKKEECRVYYDEHELLYKYDEKSIIVTISDFLPDNPFVVKIIYGNTEEQITGWYINPFLLEQNRYKDSKESLDNYEYASDSTDKYLQDQIAIIKQLSLSKEEYDRENSVMKMVELNTTDDIEDTSNEDGIIDYVIPSADVLSAYNRYMKVNKIKSNYIQWYLSGFKLFSAHSEIPNEQNNSRNELSFKKPRKSTTEERRFRMFVSKRLKELFASNLEKMISFESYLQIVLVFVNVFEKYTIIEKVEDMFDYRFVADSEYELLVRLLSKEIPDNAEIKNTVILLALQNIIDTHKIGMSEYKYDLYNREFLPYIDNLLGIRESYKIYLKTITEKLAKYGKNISLKSLIPYFEDTFGYLPFNTLEKLIESIYGKNAKILQSSDVFLINTYVDSLSEYMKMDFTVAEEVLRYAAHYKTINQLKVIVSNKKAKPIKNGDPAISVEYIIDLHTGKGKQIIKRLSGNSDVQQKIEYY